MEGWGAGRLGGDEGSNGVRGLGVGGEHGLTGRAGKQYKILATQQAL